MQEIKCLICGKVLILPEEGDGDHRQQSSIGEFFYSYHRYQDISRFLFGICDECFAAKREAGLLIPNGSLNDDIENTFW
jgi:hypothetical protein